MSEIGSSQAVAPSMIPQSLASEGYFSVSPVKLVVMSVCTFGIYEIYWFYKHWGAIKKENNLDINPLARAIFAIFFCYDLFKRIQSAAALQKLKTFRAPRSLAIGWVIVNLLWRLPDPYWLVSFLSVLFLLPVQTTANALNLISDPGRNPNAKFTKWNIVGVVFGGLLWSLILVGLFLPAE
jgi:hypothetical protein